MLGRTYMPNEHIAHIVYIDVLSDAFSSSAEADSYVKSVEAAPSDIPRIIFHQAARFLWLADRMDDIAKGRPSLQILFYIITAETVSKLFFEYQGEGKSKAHVLKFFSEFCNDRHRDCLSKAFKKNRVFMTSDEAISFLYNIRCDVAHRGNYYNLFLPNDPTSGPMSPLTTMVNDDFIEPHISSAEIRQILSEGSVRASQLFIKNH